MASTLILSADLLRVLSVGLDRLGDGDLDDRALVDRMDALLAGAGYLRAERTLWEAGLAEVQEWKDARVREEAEGLARETAWAEKWTACKAAHPGEDEHVLYSRYADVLMAELNEGR